MEQIVEIDLPVPLGVDVHGQDDSRRFTGDALLHELFVLRIVGFEFIEMIAEFSCGQIVDGCAAALSVAGALLADILRLRVIKPISYHRIPRRVFVDVGRAMADPLPSDKDRHDVVEFEFHHFKRSRVAMPSKVSDEAAILVDLLGAFAIGNAGGLHDGEVGGLADRGQPRHYVAECDETVVMHIDFQTSRAAHDIMDFGLEGLSDDLNFRCHDGG